MARNLVAGALFAGVAAGLIAAVLQLVFIQPVLLQAERYESGELVHFGQAADHDHAAAGHDDAHDSGAPANALIRNGWTLIFSALLYAGYGLILVAAMGFARARGVAIDTRSGLLWGIAGFIAVQLAPAAGLAPELPGAATADLVARQVWWAGTVAVSALGIAAIAFGRSPVHIGLGGVLLLAPHLIGAPEPEVLTGVVPPELAGAFAGRALAVGLAAWALLGSFAGAVIARHRTG